MQFSKSLWNSQSQLCCSLFNSSHFHQIIPLETGQFFPWAPTKGSKASSYWSTTQQSLMPLLVLATPSLAFSHPHSQTDLCWFQRKLWIISAELLFNFKQHNRSSQMHSGSISLSHPSHPWIIHVKRLPFPLSLGDFWLARNMRISGLSLRTYEEDKCGQCMFPVAAVLF